MSKVYIYLHDTRHYDDGDVTVEAVYNTREEALKYQLSLYANPEVGSKDYKKAQTLPDFIQFDINSNSGYFGTVTYMVSVDLNGNETYRRRDVDVGKKVPKKSKPGFKDLFLPRRHWGVGVYGWPCPDKALASVKKYLKDRKTEFQKEYQNPPTCVVELGKSYSVTVNKAFMAFAKSSSAYPCGIAGCYLEQFEGSLVTVSSIADGLVYLKSPKFGHGESCWGIPNDGILFSFTEKPI